MPMLLVELQMMERSVLRHSKSQLEWPPLLLLEEVAESTEMSRGHRHPL
jgi:hypothetical protein